MARYSPGRDQQLSEPYLSTYPGNEQLTAREERKTVRKDYKKAKKRWEEEWWMEIVEDARKAELQGDIGTLYKTLKRIGIRDNCTFEDETFSPEEFRSHFMKVSENRYERGRDEIVKTLEEIPERTDQTALEAAIELERVVTWREFETELAKMRDGAPGNYGVRMLAVKVASKPIKQQLHRMIVRLIDMKPEDWPEEIKEGWVIPLHKKGPKNDLGNYRGVCLLPLASRLIARIFATRLRTWAATICMRTRTVSVVVGLRLTQRRSLSGWKKKQEECTG